MPLRIKRVGQRMTLQEFQQRNPSPIPPEELALINQVEPDAVLQRSQQQLPETRVPHLVLVLAADPDLDDFRGDHIALQQALVVLLQRLAGMPRSAMLRIPSMPAIRMDVGLLGLSQRKRAFERRV